MPRIWNLEPTPEEEAAALERRWRRQNVVKKVKSYTPLLIVVLLISSAVALVSMELRLRTPEDQAVGVFKFRHVRTYLNTLGSRTKSPGPTYRQPSHVSGGVG